MIKKDASVCNWELELSFRSDQQLRDFICLLMRDEVLYDFECETVLEPTFAVYYVRIRGSWANNLVAVSKMAYAVDFKSDNSEMYEE